MVDKNEDVVYGKILSRANKADVSNLGSYLDKLHSVEQKSIGLKFSKSRNGSHVTYSCHHKSSRFTFPGVRLAVLLEKDEANGPSPS